MPNPNWELENEANQDGDFKQTVYSCVQEGYYTEDECIEQIAGTTEYHLGTLLSILIIGIFVTWCIVEVVKDAMYKRWRKKQEEEERKKRKEWLDSFK